MKKYFIITVSLLFFATAFSFAQVDSSDLMNSIKQVSKQQNRLEKQQKKVQRSNRKLEKQQKRLNRQNRKLNKENKRSNKEMRELERDQKKLEEAKLDSASGAGLYNHRKLTSPNRINKKQYLPPYVKQSTSIVAKRNYNRKSIPVLYNAAII